MSPAARDYGRLFVGAFVQWLLSAAFVRVTSARAPLSTFTVVLIGQSLWWLNIQHTTRSDSLPRMIAWVTGAALGAAVGTLL